MYLCIPITLISCVKKPIEAANPQSYLIKEVHETKFHNVTGNQKIQLYSLGLVANWMWFFQRDDINLRNQWSNYTNWLYNNIIPYPPTKDFKFERHHLIPCNRNDYVIAQNGIIPDLWWKTYRKLN